MCERVCLCGADLKMGSNCSTASDTKSVAAADTPPPPLTQVAPTEATITDRDILQNLDDNKVRLDKTEVTPSTLPTLHVNNRPSSSEGSRGLLPPTAVDREEEEGVM